MTLSLPEQPSRNADEIAKQFPLGAQHFQDGAIKAGGAASTGTPGTIAPDDTAAEGSATSLARSDHRHAITAGIASTLAGTNAEGSNATFARSDHNHAFPNWGTHVSTARTIADPPAQITLTTAFRMYYVQIPILRAATLTGIRYRVGGTSAGNVIVGLYDSGGTKIAESSSTAVGTAAQIQSVPFTATEDVAPGLYFPALIFNNTTVQFQAAQNFAPNARQVEGSLALPASITAPTAPDVSLAMPLMSTY